MEFAILDSIDSRRAINLYCKLTVPPELELLITRSWKRAEYEDYGRTEFYIIHVTPTYKIERWLAKESRESGERYMQLAHTGYGDLHAWHYVH